jgi:hypothetical protein
MERDQLTPNKKQARGEKNKETTEKTKQKTKADSLHRTEFCYQPHEFGRGFFLS